MIFQAIAALHLWFLAADEEGATMIEYALIVCLVSLAIGALIPELRASLDELFTRTATALSSAAAVSQAP